MNIWNFVLITFDAVKLDKHSDVYCYYRQIEEETLLVASVTWISFHFTDLLLTFILTASRNLNVS